MNVVKQRVGKWLYYLIQINQLVYYGSA